jgi:hypothetical protein|eukprot:COSAG06_NODE_2734_length_6368_cov_44.250439_4_plen_84_part_00
MEPRFEARAQLNSFHPYSEFIGVTWDRRNAKWCCVITYEGNNKHLGYFDDELEAAQSYDDAARRIRGERAHGATNASSLRHLC